MTEPSHGAHERSYGCSFACGNPYDFVLVDIKSGDALLLCVACFIRQAYDMVEAWVNANSEAGKAAMTLLRQEYGEQVPGPRPRHRGKNAPADIDDPDVFAAFDTVITEDELPDEFKPDPNG